MSKIDDLAAVFRDHVAVGWPSGSSGAQRVIMVVYDPADERALRKQIPLFEQAANAHNYRWRTVDITALFGAWLAAHRYREDYFEEPDMLRSGADGRFSLHVAAELEAVLNRPEHDAHELVALVGAASLFGVTSLGRGSQPGRDADPRALGCFLPWPLPGRTLSFARCARKLGLSRRGDQRRKCGGALMTLIAELLDRDPRGERLVNNGQARLAGSEDEAREELKTFVCEGRYAEGIAKVLEAFCRDLDNTSQQATWISGYYGSGKSHLLKMLEYLWRNSAFPDGMTPRNLGAEPAGKRARRPEGA